VRIRFYHRFVFVLMLGVLFTPILYSQGIQPDTSVCRNTSDAFEYHMDRGGFWWGRRDYTQSLDHYSCAIDLQPESMWAYRGRSQAYQSLGFYQLALSDIDIAIEYVADNSSLHNNRGWILYSMRRFEAAIESLNTAIQLAPDNAIAYNNRGLTNMQMGNLSDAISDFQNSINFVHSPPHFPYINLGNLYRSQGNYQQALSYYELSIREVPNYLPAYQLAGDLHLTLGNLEIGEQYYRDFIALSNSAVDPSITEFVDNVSRRYFIQRSLPTLLIILILAYFVFDAIRRWWLATRLQPTTTVTAMTTTTSMITERAVTPSSSPTESTSESLKTPSHTESTTQQDRSWLSLLVLPVLAGVAVVLSRIFPSQSD